MKRRYLSLAITMVTGCAIVAALMLSPGWTPAAQADDTFRAPPLTQNWAATNLIDADNDWSQVPSITGCSGVDPSTTEVNRSPATVLHDLSTTCGHVKANQSSPNAFVDIGWSVAQFRTQDGDLNATVAIRPQTDYDFPHLLIAVDASNHTDVRLQYNVKDIDGSGRDSLQEVSLQYRLGTTGNFVDVPQGWVADATDGNAKGKVTEIDVSLPAWSNAAQLQFRIMTANRSGSDEWVGIDDIQVTGTLDTTTPPGPTATHTQPGPTATVDPALDQKQYLPIVEFQQ